MSKGLFFLFVQYLLWYTKKTFPTLNSNSHSTKSDRRKISSLTNYDRHNDKEGLDWTGPASYWLLRRRPTLLPSRRRTWWSGTIKVRKVGTQWPFVTLRVTTLVRVLWWFPATVSSPPATPVVRVRFVAGPSSLLKRKVDAPVGGSGPTSRGPPETGYDKLRLSLNLLLLVDVYGQRIVRIPLPPLSWHRETVSNLFINWKTKSRPNTPNKK